MSLAMLAWTGQSIAERVLIQKQGPRRRHSEGTMKSKQSGITLIGFIVVLAVAAFFAYMAMKLVPAYTEYEGVVRAMNQIATEGVEGKTLDQVRRDMAFKLGMQYVDDSTLHPSNITFGQGASGNELRVNYDKDVPFMYNIDFLIHFSKAVPVQGNVAPPQ
jgi:Tfp pilus assembly major pilin PilA